MFKKMDIKGAAVYVGALILGDFNQSLQTFGLIANLFYIVYQYRILKNKQGDDEPNH